MEEDAGMSKNAQFRAIQPSTSILSYVEDDFRGRRRLIELKRAGYNTDLSTPLDSIPFSTSSERERIEENILKSIQPRNTALTPFRQIEESLGANNQSVDQPPAMMVSSKSGAGLRGSRTALSKIARFGLLES